VTVPTSAQIDAYESAAGRIAAAIEGLSEEQLLYSPAPGEWSIHEVLVHLPDSEVFVYERVRRILAEDHPTLQAFSEEVWARNLGYRNQDARLALDLFRAIRCSNAALLRTVPASAWERTGMHSERGEMSLYDVFAMYLDHGETHLKQIEQVKRSMH
jgi:hypothetical protein